MMDKKNKVVLKITTSVWKNASRDMRELTVVRELGADVIVMAKGEKTGIWDDVNGFSVYRMSTRPWGKYIPKGINRFISMFTWAYHARRFQPDVISGHDLIALYIGWISTWFKGKNKRPKLVYDSHEFTIYAGNRSKINRFLVTVLERFLIKKCAFVIEVNDKIADEVQQIHKLKERPIVVRNVPEKWAVDPRVCAATRKKIEEEFEVRGGEGYFLLMYHGGVMPDRGIEMLIRLVERNPQVAAMILGSGEKVYVGSLKEKAGLVPGNRIYFHEAVPQKDLWKYVGAADVGMILAPASCKNHFYSLPNKFFENIQSETPIICPNYPAMDELMEKYKIGLSCNPENLEELTACVEKLYTDVQFYQSCTEHLKLAKEELNWQNEQIVLKEAYAVLL